MDLSKKSGGPIQKDTASSSGRRKQKNPQKTKMKTEVEEYLHELVSGDAGDVLENINESPSDVWSNHPQTKSAKFKAPEAEGKRKPAWSDADDSSKRKKEKDDGMMKTNKPGGSSTTYSEELQSRFTKITGTPSWADLSKKDRSKGSDEEDMLVARVGDYIVKSNRLPRESIDVKFCRSLAGDHHELGCITGVEFHPNAQVALAAGLLRKAILYQVDGEQNRLIQSVSFERFPIHCSHFSTNGNEFIVGSMQQKHFYTFDMMSGKVIKIPWNKSMDEINMRTFYLSPDGKYLIAPGVAGAMHFLSATSKEWLYTLKMNSKLRGITFNGDSSQMYSHSDNGEVYIWDMKTRDCIHKFEDDGCIEGTSLTLSPNQQYLACGSNTGVVNIYDTAALLNSVRPKPMKSLYNLTTSATCLKFNCTSEILAMCSKSKENALKLIHFPSMEVFHNFPNFKWKLGSIMSLDLSLNSGYLTTCSKEGAALLFRHKTPTTYWATLDAEGWTNEMYGLAQIAAAQANISIESIIGTRAPFLQGNGDIEFQALVDSGFKYDCTMPTRQYTDPPMFPFTLDYKYTMDCQIAPCPVNSYPGFWEVPLVDFNDTSNIPCAMLDACPVTNSSDEVLNFFKYNFDKHYTTNKAPFGIFTHASWFLTDASHWPGYLQFIQYLNTLPDVYIVTVSKAIEWMKNPTALADLANFEPWACPTRNNACNPKINCFYPTTVVGGERYMNVCGACPPEYPWVGDPFGKGKPSSH